MCFPVGKIADVFVRWCIEYRKGEKFNIQTAEKIAKEVDPNFEISGIVVDAKRIGSEAYKKQLFESAKKIKRTIKMRGKKYTGVYAFLPVSDMALQSGEGLLDSFMLYIFGTLGPYVGDDACLNGSFGHEKGRNAIIFFAYCDKMLHDKILSNIKLDTLDYWYKHTKGKEKKGFEKRIRKRYSAFKELAEELKEEKMKQNLIR